jgi:hypothetical protein
VSDLSVKWSVKGDLSLIESKHNGQQLNIGIALNILGFDVSPSARFNSPPQVIIETCLRLPARHNLNGVFLFVFNHIYPLTRGCRLRGGGNHREVGQKGCPVPVAHVVGSFDYHAHKQTLLVEAQVVELAQPGSCCLNVHKQTISCLKEK